MCIWVTSLHAQAIFPHSSQLWVFLVLLTEVLCDSVLLIYECSNEPYITSSAEDIGNSHPLGWVIDTAKKCDDPELENPLYGGAGKRNVGL